MHLLVAFNIFSTYIRSHQVSYLEIVNSVAVAAHLRGMRPTLTQRKAIQRLIITQNIH